MGNLRKVIRTSSCFQHAIAKDWWSAEMASVSLVLSSVMETMTARMEAMKRTAVEVRACLCHSLLKPLEKKI